MKQMRRGGTIRWLPGGLALVVAASLAAQELPEIQETVDVRVVNVDVVVTDGEGREVRGLSREDFELQVNGRPQAIDYFSSVVDGLPFEVEASEEEQLASLPYLAIVYDGRGQSPGAARRTFDGLRARLDSLVARTRAVMVVMSGRRLIVEQPLTRDREQLGAALERLAVRRVPATDAGSRSLLMSQLEAANPPRLVGESEDELIANRARMLLQQIRSQAELERFDVDSSVRQIRSFIRSVAGLPGRKAILFLGEGLQLRPGEALFRVWWRKFRRYAPRLGVGNIEAEMAMVRAELRLVQLVEEANAHRVSIYTHDPAGLRTVGSSVEFGTLEANQHLEQEAETRLESLVDLALATGGIGSIRAAGVEPLLDRMLAGFGSYYSLGFEPQAEGRGNVRVRLREPGLRLRYLNRFTARTTAQGLEEATLATLLTSAGENPLEVGVELGDAELQGDGTYLVPLLIKVPMARLTLLPRRAHHVGRLSFVVMAQSADGDLSPSTRGQVPIEIANDELLSVMGRVAGYRLQLKMAAGEQTVAIGVRDDVAREDTTLRLVLSPGQDT